MREPESYRARGDGVQVRMSRNSLERRLQLRFGRIF